ncbi:MAG TPA: hypothetical protein VD886_24465, partial [Herpetosiphonaceae bacterium]|nr:hypothetical protein [Herpetosiphonaceae bacterium]
QLLADQARQDLVWRDRTPMGATTAIRSIDRADIQKVMGFSWVLGLMGQAFRTLSAIVERGMGLAAPAAIA